MLRLLGLIQQIATTEKSHVYLLQHHRLRIAHYKTTANHQTGALFEKGFNNKVQVLFPFTLLFNDCALLFLLTQTTPVHCGVIPGGRVGVSTLELEKDDVGSGGGGDG